MRQSTPSNERIDDPACDGDENDQKRQPHVVSRFIFLHVDYLRRIGSKVCDA